MIVSLPHHNGFNATLALGGAPMWVTMTQAATIVDPSTFSYTIFGDMLLKHSMLWTGPLTHGGPDTGPLSHTAPIIRKLGR